MTDSEHTDKSESLFLCRASGEGSHNFRVATDEAGVLAFYDEMFGKEEDGTLDLTIKHFRDPDNWSNEGTAYDCELYCARFEVWKVDPQEIAAPRPIRSGDSESASLANEIEQYCQSRESAGLGLLGRSSMGGREFTADEEAMVVTALRTLSPQRYETKEKS